MRHSTSEEASRPCFAFPKQFRVRLRRDYARVFATRCSVADGRLVVYITPNGLTVTRLGLSVGRKVGKAVVRNRTKRLLREAFRLCRHDLPVGYDMVCIPRQGAAASLDDYKRSLRRLLMSAVKRFKRREGGPGSEPRAQASGSRESEK